MTEHNIDREEDRLREMFASLEHGAVAPPLRFLERLKEESTRAFLAAEPSRPEHRKQVDMRTLRRFGSLAAACIALVVALAVWWPGSESGIASTAYADLMRAVDSSADAEWVHIKYPQPYDFDEGWGAFQPLRELCVKHGQRVVFKDARTGLQHTYEFNTNTITIESLRSQHPAAQRSANFLDFVREVVQQWVDEDPNTSLTISDTMIDGRVFQVYSLRSAEKPSCRQDFVVDPEVNRVVRVIQENTEVKKINTVEIDYPAVGPADIYFGGFVPRDAEVIDKTRQESSQESSTTAASARAAD